MKYIAKFSGFILSIYLFAISNSVYAELTDDANKIFNWAEIEYPQYFPNGPATSTVFEWIYRCYASTGDCVGVEPMEEGVYVLGPDFGTSDPVFIDTVSEVLVSVNGGENEGLQEDCVKVGLASGLVQASTVLTYKITSSEREQDPDYITKTFVEATETITKTNTNKNEGFAVTETVTQEHHRIVDNMLLQEESVADSEQVFAGPLLINTSTRIHYSPSMVVGPVTKFCEMQTWTTRSVIETKTIITGGKETTSESETMSYTGSVEAVNEELDTFWNSPWTPTGTVRTRIVYKDGSSRVSWISILQGIVVRSESYDSSGRLNVVKELVSAGIKL